MNLPVISNSSLAMIFFHGLAGLAEAEIRYCGIGRLVRLDVEGWLGTANGVPELPIIG